MCNVGACLVDPLKACVALEGNVVSLYLLGADMACEYVFVLGCFVWAWV